MKLFFLLLSASIVLCGSFLLHRHFTSDTVLGIAMLSESTFICLLLLWSGKSLLKKQSETQAALEASDKHNEERFKDLQLRTQEAKSTLKASIEANNQQCNDLQNTINIVHSYVIGLEEQLDSLEETINHINTLIDKVHGNTRNMLQIRDMLNKTDKMYKLISSGEERIASQEQSLNGLVERHVKIAELTEDLNKTSHAIFELMRLILIDSISEQVHNKRR